MTTTPDLLEIETSEMTKNYRASRHQIWKQLQARNQENRDRALQHGATSQQATEHANKLSRGEVGVFVWELLTRAHRDAAALFFERAPVSWAVQAEVLLASPEVPTLIDRTYPIVSWAQKINQITREVAETRQAMATATSDMLATFYGGASAAAAATARALGSVAEGAGSVAGGVGNAVGGFGDLARGLGTGLGRLPLALAAIGVAALTFGLVFATRKDEQQRIVRDSGPGSPQ